MPRKDIVKLGELMKVIPYVETYELYNYDRKKITEKVEVTAGELEIFKDREVFMVHEISYDRVRIALVPE